MKPVSLSLNKLVTTYNAKLLSTRFVRLFTYQYSGSILLLLLLLTSSKSFAFGQEKVGFAAVGFRGAEMYTQYTTAGKVTVYLKKYYDCGKENNAETEQVSLFESVSMSSKEGIVLKKISDTTQKNMHLQTPGHSDWGCLNVITYSAELPLSPGRNEYDITWGYQGLSGEIVNLGKNKDRGFVLSVHVAENDEVIENTMPTLTSLPVFMMEAGKNMSNKIEFEDKDRDVVTLSVSAPNSLEPVKQDARVVSNTLSPVLPEQSVLTARGPFKAIDLNSKNPIDGKVFSISPEGAFNYHPGNTSGKYLAAITIKEKRENKILSEHQCVFVIDVKQ